MTKVTLKMTTEEALDAFWNVIVHRYPDATTGDLSPWATIKLTLAAENAVSEWVRNNAPSSDHNRIVDKKSGVTAPKHSPAPWSYAYSPYIVQSEASPLGVGAEIPAFEVFDADYNKVFDTNEDTDAGLQEANACLASTAPRLLDALIVCASLLADYDEAEGEEGDAYREAKAAVTEATGRAA